MPSGKWLPPGLAGSEGFPLLRQQPRNHATGDFNAGGIDCIVRRGEGHSVRDFPRLDEPSEIHALYDLGQGTLVHALYHRRTDVSRGDGNHTDASDALHVELAHEDLGPECYGSLGR